MYQRQVTFMEAVQSALTVNFCNFAGRASRSQYWWFVLFTALVGFVIGIVFCWSSDLLNIVSAVVNLVFLLPGLGLCVRRLHDIGKSGWWVLLGLIPVVGTIVLIIWFCQNSQMYDNQWGPVPNLVA